MPRLNLPELPRETRDTWFMLVVIAWVLAPLWRELPLWCTLLGAAVIGWRGVLAWRARPLPGRWIKLTLLAAVLVATVASHHSLLGRDAGVTLVAVLLTLKTLELRARRDALVIFFLCFFVLLTQCFYSQSLLTATAMLIGLWGLLTALVNAHLPVGRPPLWLAARTAGAMTLLGIPVMVLLFVLFPRVAPLWGLPADALAGRSGLSAQMTVGHIARLALDDSVALRVRFEGQPPAPSALYFRGPVLSRTNGQRWEAMDPPLTSVADASLQTQGEGVRYQMTLQPQQNPWLLTLDVTAQAPVLEGSAPRPRVSTELQWVLGRPITDLLRYQAVAHTTFQYGQTMQREQLRPYLAWPIGFNARTEQWGRELRAAAPAGEEPARYVIAQALQRLRSGGYVYTLEPGVFGRDTADEFWFDRKAGFCEHIASSFALLLRAAGVPSRVVTGYQGGQRNALDDFWTVRQSDAHAWVEAWLDGVGWQRIDPTAAVSPARVGTLTRLQAPRGVLTDALLGTLLPAVALNLRALWDAVNNRWNQWVLNYTQTRQLDLLKSLGLNNPSWEDLIRLLGSLTAALALAGAAWGFWQHQQRDPWLRLLAQARQRMQAAGYQPGVHSTPRELADLLKARPSASGDADTRHQALHGWLLQLEALRYAKNSGASARALATLRRQFKHLYP